MPNHPTALVGTARIPTRPKSPPPDMADLRRTVQGWLDAPEPPPDAAALSACRSLRQMIESFARVAQSLAVKQPTVRRRDALVRAAHALRQTHLQERPGLTAHELSQLLAQTLLDMIALCESLAGRR